jgi:beta-N-acetylhexosaminidase
VLVVNASAPVRELPADDYELPARNALERIGTRLMVGVPGTRLDSTTREALATGRIGGVILMAHNITSEAQLKRLTGEIRDATIVPPLIAIDHEGGSVNRLRAKLGRKYALASARSLGNRSDAALAVENRARNHARLLKALGINVNFAPVADLGVPGSSVLAGRTYSSDPEHVAKMMKAFATGAYHEGVLHFVKHYPGHGMTAHDTHHRSVMIEVSEATLRKHEDLFYHAYEAGIPGIMLGHLTVARIDPDRPASVSPAWMERLRQNAPDALTITDSGSMAALSGTPLERAEMALEAGVDIYLTTRSFESLGQNFADALAERVPNDALSLSTSERVFRYRWQLGEN